jgi:integrase/recombinase XerD
MFTPQPSSVIMNFVAEMRLARFSPYTIDARLDVLRRLQDHLGAPLLTATADQLDAYQSRWTLLAPASANIYARHVKAFYAWAVKRSLLPVDPSEVLVVPQVRRGMPHPTRPEDLRKIFACTDGPLRLAYVLAAFVGLRRGEICEIQRHDIFLDGEPVLLVHGKGGKERKVPLLPAPLAELRSRSA